MLNVGEGAFYHKGFTRGEQRERVHDEFYSTNLSGVLPTVAQTLCEARGLEGEQGRAPLFSRRLPLRGEVMRSSGHHSMNK